MASFKYFSILLIAICMGFINCEQETQDSKSYLMESDPKYIFFCVTNKSSKTFEIKEKNLDWDIIVPQANELMAGSTNRFLIKKNASKQAYTYIGHFKIKGDEKENVELQLSIKKIKGKRAHFTVNFIYRDTEPQFSHRFDEKNNLIIFDSNPLNIEEQH